ncbi:FAD/NAD(P)-binding protein [Spelaeicoccus albus]|uniref:FAD-dependent urate hydroxylase HpyO/Asp monooxygenase CreE-like FAD/NAD(P)-binding domain-containing protein n=1 Tax=Spelaeicoccus albus TaxID=1280376 RepID=A0A7Z0IHB4_9MICO|nr:FAD/NAD(P)-binding protein [Spelaeicoccus albus]NYI67462.1 hypothetical protein [Spelaeicoccus albus]
MPRRGPRLLHPKGLKNIDPSYAADPHVLTVAVIGAGPRGTSVIERLVAHAAELDASLTIHVVDPHPAGSGQVWRDDQSPLLLMNTQPGDQTVYPDSSTTFTPRDTGPDMADWLRQVAAGNSDEPADVVAEARALTPSSFPSRRLYGAYLRAAYHRIAREAPPSVRLLRHATRARALRETADGRQVISLADGTELMATHVVLALGHLPAQPTTTSRRWRDFADAHQLVYQPPALPADVDWDRMAPPGERIIFRGIALNFFDICAMVTEGRGGRFVPDGARLTYLPSGREPVLIAGSRRGVPYRAKPIVDGVPLPRYHHRFFTASALEARRRQAQSGQLAFNRDVFGLLQRDALWIYYQTLARTDPEAIHGDVRELLDHLEHRATDSAWEALAARLVPDESYRFDVHRLIAPAAGLTFDGYDEWHRWAVAYLDADAAQARRGVDSPVKMAALAIYTGREMVKRLVLVGAIEPASFLDEVRGWFEDVAQTLGSGPPLRRIEALSALARCGLVKFIGPRMQVDTRNDGSARFVATSPAVAGSEFAAERLAEALAPANRVSVAADGLLRDLLDTGAARPKSYRLPDLTTVPGTGLDVSARPHRLIDGAGRTHPRRYVIGLQLSSVEWGTAIAATPGTNAISLGDADAIARDILGLKTSAPQSVVDLVSRVRDVT